MGKLYHWKSDIQNEQPAYFWVVVIDMGLCALDCAGFVGIALTLKAILDYNDEKYRNDPDYHGKLAAQWAITIIDGMGLFFFFGVIMLLIDIVRLKRWEVRQNPPSSLEEENVRARGERLQNIHPNSSAPALPALDNVPVLFENPHPLYLEEVMNGEGSLEPGPGEPNRV
jgi:hypothetical protein